MEGDNPRGHVIRTVGWFLLAITGLGVIGRSAVKAGVIRRIGADDVFIWLAFVFFVGQVTCVHLEVAQGLGESGNALSPLSLKLDWAQNLLFMPVYGFAKLSVVSLLRKFTLGKRDRLRLYCFEWLLACWSISSEFVWAFECQLPAPWDYVHQSCINRTAWAVYFEAINIVTDLILVLIPSVVILSLKAPLKRRITSASFFIARLIIIPASAMRIYFWIVDTSAADLSYSLFTYTIVTMLVCSLEILMGCLLYVQPLFESLESGFMWGGDLRRRGQGFKPALGFSTRATLSFTKMRNPFENGLFGGNYTEYSVRAEGPEATTSEDEEKDVSGREGNPPDGIQMDQTVDVHTSPEPQDRQPMPGTKEAAMLLQMPDPRPLPKHHNTKGKEPAPKRNIKEPPRIDTIIHEEPSREVKRSTQEDTKRHSDRSSKRLSDSIFPFFGSKWYSGEKRAGKAAKANRDSTPQLDVDIPDSLLHATPIVNRSTIFSIAEQDVEKQLPALPPQALDPGAAPASAKDRNGPDVAREPGRRHNEK